MYKRPAWDDKRVFSAIVVRPSSSVAFFKKGKALGNSFGLNSGKDNMITVHDDDRTRTAPMGGIDQTLIFFGLVLEAFHRCRIGRYNRHNPIRYGRTPKSNIQ